MVPQEQRHRRSQRRLRRRNGRHGKTTYRIFPMYRLLRAVIILAGLFFFAYRGAELWRIHDNMRQTMQQKQQLQQENTALKQQKSRLEDPEEVVKEARRQFGLAKPGEIPYKR